MATIASNSTQILPEAVTQVTKEAVSQNASFKCPGHNEFFHHYNNYDKAKRKAQEAIDDLLKNSSVESAHYKLLEKGTAIGDESGYFNRLNNVYKYAIELVYLHKDNAEECSFYQEFKKQNV